ncbi:MAG TPA: hypothetical protein VFC21_12925 [Bryobacteraceae bacterium]|nr:hypothetical protein [Bryobacteraceae bacterium]
MNTALDRIRCRPSQVQAILQCKMTVDSLEDREPDFEAYARRALDWWEETRRLFPEPEEVLAALVIDRLRKKTTWGGILRGKPQ